MRASRCCPKPVWGLQEEDLSLSQSIDKIWPQTNHWAGTQSSLNPSTRNRLQMNSPTRIRFRQGPNVCQTSWRESEFERINKRGSNFKEKADKNLIPNNPADEDKLLLIVTNDELKRPFIKLIKSTVVGWWTSHFEWLTAKC